MFKDFIKQEAGVEWYSIVSLLIFVGFFLAVTAYAMLRRKDLMQEMSRLPLADLADGPITSESIKTNSHE